MKKGEGLIITKAANGFLVGAQSFEANNGHRHGVAEMKVFQILGTCLTDGQDPNTMLLGFLESHFKSDER